MDQVEKNTIYIKKCVLLLDSSVFKLTLRLEVALTIAGKQ